MIRYRKLNENLNDSLHWNTSYSGDTKRLSALGILEDDIKLEFLIFIHEEEECYSECTVSFKGKMPIASIEIGDDEDSDCEEVSIGLCEELFNRLRNISNVDRKTVVREAKRLGWESNF